MPPDPLAMLRAFGARKFQCPRPPKKILDPPLKTLRSKFFVWEIKATLKMCMHNLITLRISYLKDIFQLLECILFGLTFFNSKATESHEILQT